MPSKPIILQPLTWRPAAHRAPLARVAVLLLLTAALGACAPRLPTAYSPPLQQGNVIEQESLAKLKPGMTRSQVRFALGTPLIVDVFRDDRWDYVYLLRRQGQPAQQRRVTVIFDGDALARLEGDVVAGSGSGLPAESKAKAKSTAAAAEPVAERGFFGRMFERIGF